MNRIRILDCTLRDGGYCNQWNFEKMNIVNIIKGLDLANIDIIECGYISELVDANEDLSIYRNISDINPYIQNISSMNVCMINYGEYHSVIIPDKSDVLIKGIRVAFHKKDLENAIEFCKEIQKKGYLVFVQPMVTLSYTDEEFLHLLDKINELEPYAFYVVDSFGVMKGKDLLRYFYLTENRLNSQIIMGYHAHNNLQLAYANAQMLCAINTKRNLIIDTSVFGMGRGAGNLNTELFAEFLNDSEDTNYQLKPLLTIIDDILLRFYQSKFWGYSLPNYLSAIHNIHPNYATFLSDKQTLTVEDMDNIFHKMDSQYKISYNEDYIEQLYNSYMLNINSTHSELVKLRKVFTGKDVLLIAPGMSCKEQKEDIIQFVSNHKEALVVSINFDSFYIPVDFVFVSNIKRFRKINQQNLDKCIITSNVKSNECFEVVSYEDLLSNFEDVKDNAGLMFLQLLNKLEVRNVFIAGMDGYKYQQQDNYMDEKMLLEMSCRRVESINRGMGYIISQLSNSLNINFITRTNVIYENNRSDKN